MSANFHLNSHPHLQGNNPHELPFLKMLWLSDELTERLGNTQGVLVGAAVMRDMPHSKMVAAYGMLMDDYQQGRYEGVHTLVVPSSGNTAYAVALLAPAFGISRVKLIIASDVPSAKQNLIRMLPGAMVMNPGDQQTTSQVAKEEARKPGHHLLDQYAHMANVLIHKQCTGPRLLDMSGRELGLVAIAMGSGGTVTGVSQFLKEKDPSIVVIGVRPKPGEAVPGTRNKARMDAVVTLPYEEAVDDIVEVSRKNSFLAARRLMTEVHPLPGPSSGLACFGLMEYLNKPGMQNKFKDKKAVFLCPDSATLYADLFAAELTPEE